MRLTFFFYTSFLFTQKMLSHIAHVHHTSNSEGGKSEYHRERSVNFFPVVHTGRDLCLFPNLRQQWIPVRLLVKGHFHLTYFKRFLNYRRGKETSLRHNWGSVVIFKTANYILYYFCSSSKLSVCMYCPVLLRWPTTFATLHYIRVHFFQCDNLNYHFEHLFIFWLVHLIEILFIKSFSQDDNWPN